MHILYTYKFLKDIIFKFVDCKNSGFLHSRIIFNQPLSSICIVIAKKIEDLIFVDDKLPMKKAKTTFLENYFVYGMYIVGLRDRIPVYFVPKDA